MEPRKKGSLMYDSRNARGYREIPASDPEEQRLRLAFFAARGRATHTGHGEDIRLAETAYWRLADYIWARAQADAAADRKRHPKARRNQIPPPRTVIGSGRSIP